jgi:hypothetical protein
VTKADDDAGWRRPPGGDGPDRSAPVGPAAPTRPIVEYGGPPPSNPPPANWRPPLVQRPVPPRQLPEQDHDRLDVEEQAARTLSQGIGMVAGAVLLVLMLILCARALF